MSSQVAGIMPGEGERYLFGKGELTLADKAINILNGMKHFEFHFRNIGYLRIVKSEGAIASCA